MLFDTKLIRVLQVLSVSLLLASCGGGDSDTTPAKRTTPTQGVAAALPSSTWTSAPEGSGQQSPALGTAHSFLHVWDGTSDSVFRIDPDSSTLSPVGTLRFEDVVISNFVIHPSGKFAYATRT